MYVALRRSEPGTSLRTLGYSPAGSRTPRMVLSTAPVAKSPATRPPRRRRVARTANAKPATVRVGRTPPPGHVVAAGHRNERAVVVHHPVSPQDADRFTTAKNSHWPSQPAQAQRWSCWGRTTASGESSRGGMSETGTPPSLPVVCRLPPPPTTKSPVKVPSKSTTSASESLAAKVQEIKSSSRRSSW
jgi:hypothetical protein